jgi:lactoylglutathione lyase
MPTTKVMGSPSSSGDRPASHRAFPDDLDVTVDFYTNVLGFTVTKDERAGPGAYVSPQRGSVRIGAARRAVPDARAGRLPPCGAELVLEVDDVAGERDRAATAGWPLAEDLRDRSWGLTDFRVVDLAGYYLRITNRPRMRPQCRNPEALLAE